MAEADAKTETPQCGQCGKCAKTEADPDITLKRCARCKTTSYCSRDCQKADWKVHKKRCAKDANAAASTSAPNPTTNTSTSSGATAAPPPKGLSVAVDKPFHRLDDKTWLHGRPEEDVYKLLIDTYRFRMEDNYNLEGDADMDSIYGGAPDGRQGFQRFLRLAQKKSGLLPSWWTRDKVAECVAVGMMRRNNGWSDLSRAIEKSDVVEHYGNPLMPMQLRMFGEQVYGRGPGGQNGDSMRMVQMMVENGGMAHRHMDLASVLSRG